MRQTSPKRLSVELLEDRLTPTTGISWYDAGKLTLSFVPDGADTGGGTHSSLSTLLGSNAAAWKREILRAYQTWAAATNLNVGLVADSGLALGAAGLPQMDPRFGDIRIAARPLSAGHGGAGDSLAQAVGFEYSGGTWSGDMVLNANNPFSIGGAGGTSDLFSVALHEAGHSFSLPDTATDPTAAMWSTYSLRIGLSASDLAAIQALYGVRSADPYEGSAGNGTTGTAFNLTQNGNLTAISADLRQVGDADVYRFTTPAGASGITGLKVNLEVAGISLLTAKVSILDAAGQVVATGVATDPLSNNVSVTLPEYQTSTTYYVKVEGAGTDVFSVGAYNLRLAYSKAYGTSAVGGSQYVNLEAASNETHATAAKLGMANAAHSTTFTVVGALATGADADWYKITPNAAAGFIGTLTVGLVPLSGNGFRPVVAVYNAAGELLPSVVVTNEDGAFTVQLGAQQTGATYYLKVSAADPTGGRAVGAYTLAANLSRTDVTTFDLQGEHTLTAAQPTVYARMTASETRLTQFSLSASAATGSPRAAVRMAVFDGQGQLVFSIVAEAGQPLATGTLWLTGGDYTIAFTAATKDGSPLTGLTFNLGKRERSDPMDPVLEDPIGLPTLPTTPAPPPATTPAPPPPPVVTILDPIPEPPAGTVLAPVPGPFPWPV
jgi:hypothetical protein